MPSPLSCAAYQFGIPRAELLLVRVDKANVYDAAYRTFLIENDRTFLANSQIIEGDTIHVERLAEPAEWRTTSRLSKFYQSAKQRVVGGEGVGEGVEGRGTGRTNTENKTIDNMRSASTNHHVRKKGRR